MSMQVSSSSSGGMGGRSYVQQRQINLNRSGSGGGMSSLKMALHSLGPSSGISGAIREVATDPQGVISHRLKEKADMQDLNERFANYLEKIRVYEVENRRLRDENLAYKQALIDLETKMRELYEKELAQVRKALDDTTKAKAAVELKVQGLEQDLAMYKLKYEEEELAHTKTKEALPKLEKSLAEKEATINYMSDSIKNLEFELSKLKGDNGVLRRELTEARIAADNVIVDRIELESQLQTKDDEIMFLKNMYEEKIRILMEIDHGDQTELFQGELAAAIRDIRAEYEAINQAQQSADTEGWYKAKFNEMMLASQRATGELTAAKEEVKSARAMYSECQKELMMLRSENAALKEQLANLERNMEASERMNAELLAEKDAEIAALRQQIASQILELKELMDSKLALDAEISTYRRLLQGEETRVSDLKLDGFSVATGGVKGGVSGGVSQQTAQGGQQAQSGGKQQQQQQTVRR